VDRTSGHRDIGSSGMLSPESDTVKARRRYTDHRQAHANLGCPLPIHAKSARGRGPPGMGSDNSFRMLVEVRGREARDRLIW